MSIRRTLLAGLLLGLTLVLGLAGVVLFSRIRSVLVREFDVALRADAAIVHSDTECDQDGKISNDTSARPDVWFQIWLPDGQTVARSANLEFNDLPKRDGDLTLPGGRPGRSMILQFVPAAAEENQRPIANIPAVTLVIARDRAALNRTIAGIGAGLLFVGALVLAMTAVVVRLAIRRGLEPLDALGRQLSTSTLQTRFETRTSELRSVVARLNELLARLDEAFQRERRVTADIAHELRTPIAELRSLAEVPEAGSMDDVLHVAKRMETMVAGLLALARHDAGLQPLAREPVNLRQVVEEVLRPLPKREVHIEVTGTWQTDPTLLRLIVGNLLTNAIEYAPEQGRIRVMASDSRLEITNSVDGIRPEDLPHLFERFWRKDESRPAGHSGLGLALAQSAANALGMKIEASMPEDKTLCVSLRF